jgi:hypothetical protein
VKPRENTWNEEEEEDKTNNNKKKPFKTVFFFSAALAGYLYPLLKLKENARVQKKRSVRSAATTCTQLRKLHETNFKEVLKFMARRCKSFRQKIKLKNQRVLPCCRRLHPTSKSSNRLKCARKAEEGAQDERERERERRGAPQQQQLSNACTAPAFVPPGWMDEQGRGG